MTAIPRPAGLLLSLLMLLALFPPRVQADSALPKPSDGYYVNDYAGVIGEKTELELLHTGVMLHKQYGTRLLLVTVKTTGGQSARDYARALYDAWDVGAGDGNALLLLLSTGDGAYAAVRGPGTEGTLSEARLSAIVSSALAPDLAAGRLNRAAAKAYYGFAQALDGVPGPAPGDKLPQSPAVYVADNAGVLSARTRDYINRTSARYRASTGSGLYVVTINNGGGSSLPDYAQAKLNSVGAGPDDILLALDVAADDYYLLQGEAAASVLTNRAAGETLDSRLEPFFARHDYGAGAVQLLLGVYGYLLERAEGTGGATNARIAEERHDGSPLPVVSTARADSLKMPAAGDGGGIRSSGQEEAPWSGIAALALLVLIALLAGRGFRPARRRGRTRRPAPLSAAAGSRRK